MAKRKRILVAPLDWGLGHATRCIPIMNDLVENRCEVVIAGNGNSLLLLQKEFPTLQSFELPGYNIKYSRGSSQVLSMIFQFPKLLRAIAAEHPIVNGLVEREKIDAIISDNRYGVYSENIPSVLITHQLRLMIPKSLTILEPLVMKSLHRYLNHFDECWVPDVEDENNLSGKLSHEVDLKTPLKYIGPLSRLKPLAQLGNGYDLLVLLSGPEPQRTLLEEKVVEQLMNSDLKVMLVQGLVKKNRKQKLRDGFDLVSYIDTNEVQLLLSRCNYVLARSGYSSVMDLKRVGKKAILIPTPGQTEQEYLAEYLSTTTWCVTASQNNLNIIESIKKLKTKNDTSRNLSAGLVETFNFDLHQQKIKSWLESF